MIKLTKDELQVLHKILETYIPIAAPMIEENELEITETIKQKVEQELGNDAD